MDELLLHSKHQKAGRKTNGMVTQKTKNGEDETMEELQSDA
jgi:hypothetical protein